MLKYFIYLTILCAHYALGTWDFAVTAKTKIVFYDEHWKDTTSSAHQFEHLSAIAFDETEEIVYFADRLHNNGSIFSLKLPTDDPDDAHIIEKVVQRTQKEVISSIAYDPLNRNIYWIDQLNKKINFISKDATEKDLPKVLIDFSKEKTKPDGLAIDICRRKIYWTNSNFKNATIECMDLSGDDRKVIRSEGLYLPRGIVVDQLSDRLYWVVDQQGMHFTVESSKLDGSDHVVIVKDIDSTPFNLAVTKDLLYWTDHRHNAVWSHPKVTTTKSQSSNQTTEDTEDADDEAEKPRHIMARLAEAPSGIVARSRFLTTLQNDQHCSGVVAKIKHQLLNMPPPPQTQDSNCSNATNALMNRKYCLNRGVYEPHSGKCLCEMKYEGLRCELDVCRNYCVRGECSTTSYSFPQCACPPGFHGDRCESHRCTGFCLNGGKCKLDHNEEAYCDCPNNFGGHRCEQNSTEICALFCRILKYEPEADAPYGCHDICEELASENEESAQIYALPQYKHLEVCKNQVTWTSTLIIALVAGVALCLSLVLLIVHGVRRFYKPVRPRIKKTFVVRRQPAGPSDTPLTNRPMTTEQCEITIENCCNMSYCDTPCFDPKMVQQSMSSRESPNTKEDKKVLIHNMEDDLY